MNAGTLWIEMAANLARLQQDMNQAKGIVSGAAKDMERTVGQLKTVLGALGVGVTFHVLKDQFDQVTERMAKLNDATEKVGSTVEKFSQLQFFGSVSGAGLESITSGLAKLSKGMVQSGNDTADTTQALKFLGLSAKDAAGNLKDPADLFTEIAHRLDDYKDGAGKAAIAQALFGKSGAELLPTMKKLVELGAVEASVTKEQAEAAENYQVQVALLNRQKEIMWNTIVGKILPSMDSFVKVMLDASTKTGSMQTAAKKLADDGSIEKWADSSAMSIAFLIDAAKTIVPLIDLAGSGLASLIARQDVALRINPLSSLGLWAMGQKPLEGYKDAVETAKTAQEEFSRKLEEFLNRDVQGTQKAMAAMIAARKANREDAARDVEGSSNPGGDVKKNLNFSPVDAKQAAAELKLYESAVKRLQHELANVNQQSEQEKLQVEMYGKNYTMADGSVVHLTGSLEKLTEGHKKILPFIAAEIDKRKQAIEVSNLQFASSEALFQSQQRLLQIQTQAVESDQTYIDDLKFQTELLGKSALQQAEMNELRKIDLDLRQRLKAAADAAGDNMAQYDAAREVLVKQAEDQKNAVRSAIASRTAAERDWLTGAQSAFNEYADHATNAAEQAKNAFNSGLHAIEDTIYQVLRHGELRFSDFISFVKDQAARLAAQEITLRIGASIAGSLGMSTAASAAGTGLGNLALSGASSSIFGTAGAYGAAVPGLTIGGEQAAMLAAQTGAFGAEGLALTSAAGGSGLAAGLAAIPGWGWGALAAGALLGGSLLGGGGPKASDAALRRRSDGSFGVEMNNVAGGDPDIAQVMALNLALNDPSKFDPAKLAGLVDTQVSTGSPADTASLIGLLTQALQPAADSAKALTQAVADQAKADDEARKAAEALASERKGLEIRLLEAQGDAAGALAAKRQLEMDATNDLNRELLRQIYAAEDASAAAAELAKQQDALAEAQKQAAEAAAQAQQEADRARAELESQRRDSVLSAVDVLRSAYERESSTLEQMASRWADAAKSLRDYGDTLVGTGTGSLTYTAAARKFSDVARRAQLGDFDAIGALQGVSEQFRTASLASSGSSLDYARDVARIQNVILNTANMADRQESVALEQRDQLRAQTEELIDVNGNLVSVKDAIDLVYSKMADLTETTEESLRESRDTRELIEQVVQGQSSLLTRTAA